MHACTARAREDAHVSPACEPCQEKAFAAHKENSFTVNVWEKPEPGQTGCLATVHSRLAAYLGKAAVVHSTLDPASYQKALEGNVRSSVEEFK